MQYVSFIRLGEPAFGVFLNNKIYDLTYQLGSGVSSLKEAIHFDVLPDNNEELEEYLAHVTSYGLTDVSFLPVIPDPGKILCIGLNYEKSINLTQILNNVGNRENVIKAQRIASEAITCVKLEKDLLPISKFSISSKSHNIFANCSDPLMFQ